MQHCNNIRQSCGRCCTFSGTSDNSSHYITLNLYQPPLNYILPFKSKKTATCQNMKNYINIPSKRHSDNPLMNVQYININKGVNGVTS